MAKSKIIYTCSACAAQFPKWQGQCTECNAWNSLQEETYREPSQAKSKHSGGYAAEQSHTVHSLNDIMTGEEQRISTGLSELDRVLGGGLVEGSVILIGGDPGIGKSTLLLQSITQLSHNQKTLYVTGEESLKQVRLRAQRLHLVTDAVRILTETHVEKILDAAQSEKPNVMVIDSIQTLFTEEANSAPGSVSQVRESAAQLVRFAKQTGTALFIVGHVTKEGAIAGPRVLEHMVDTVLYFEGEQSSRFRLIRAVKNRFGAVNELGVFAMGEHGLQEVKNPSAIFLSPTGETTPGSTVVATWEGTRPLLVEVQALVDQSYAPMPRRVAIGLDQNRLSMLLAILHKHAGFVIHDQDVFVNIVGGLRINETALDLAVLLAVVSSLRNKALPKDLVVFGEVGLSGEIRPVPNGQERLKDAAKQGIKHAIIPQANAPKKTLDGLTITGVTKLEQAIRFVMNT